METSSITHTDKVLQHWIDLIEEDILQISLHILLVITFVIIICDYLCSWLSSELIYLSNMLSYFFFVCVWWGMVPHPVDLVGTVEHSLTFGPTVVNSVSLVLILATRYGLLLREFRPLSPLVWIGCCFFILLVLLYQSL